ncbi:MAG TPA: AAA family ATPase [Candidatus Nanoarchaeia archaeon]|nr:AAA family ATPase [Candidatus Nanoarchaeia archaeon]
MIEITKIPEIERIHIKDYGIIKHAKIKFSSGLNVITGKNASGKTTIIRYLIKIFNPDLMAAGNKVMFEINNEINKNCILMDDVLCSLDKEKLVKTLKNLETCKRQVICTLNIARLEDIKSKIKANIIDTKNFKLKNERPK